MSASYHWHASHEGVRHITDMPHIKEEGVRHITDMLTWRSASYHWHASREGGRSASYHWHASHEGVRQITKMPHMKEQYSCYLTWFNNGVTGSSRRSSTRRTGGTSVFLKSNNAASRVITCCSGINKMMQRFVNDNRQVCKWDMSKERTIV